MKKRNLILHCSFALLLFACASPKKADLSSGDNADKSVFEVNQLMKKTQQAQSDLLAYEEYMDGVETLNKAKKGFDLGYDKAIILNNAAIAKNYFNEANILSAKRSPNATRILQARQSSIDAGSRNSTPLVEILWDIDDDLRDETDDFSAVLAPQEFSEFQKRYLTLEIKAVQFAKLNTVRLAVQNAASADADEVAPKTLTAAMLDLGEAENFIAQSPRNPEIHQNSVIKAKASSVLLSDVMDVILNAEGTPENIALKIIAQNRKLGALEESLKSTQSELGLKSDELKTTQSNLIGVEGVLKIQNEALAKSSTQVRFQAAMDEARRQFSENEASVYQQGSKLIFRLKKINFPSGSSFIPSLSKPLLEKINDIITTLDAEIVAVQGHTDSIGANDVNQRLSTRRAVSVSNYLVSFGGGYNIKYTGFGESRPIASNETRAGRSTNRRVDLVVTAKQ
jgi:outer membrane protein OmpA-like peptidoglycan-associated protein